MRQIIGCLGYVKLVFPFPGVRGLFLCCDVITGGHCGPILWGV